jgi:hypothetical protein
MKKSLVIVATIVAVILIGNVIVAYAQNGNPPAQRGTGVCPAGVTCPYSGTMPYGGREMMNGNQAYGYMMADDGMHEEVMTAIASKLGMTYDELTTALQTQTLAQIAAAKGVSADTLRQAATDARNAELDALVAAGTLTQAQVDFMKSRMQAMPLYGLDNDGDCPMQNGQPGNYGRGMGGWQNNGQSGTYGPGMMGGGRGQMPGGMMGGRGYAQPAAPQG